VVHVVEVKDGPVIDWTSRQFLPESPWPMILEREEVQAMWQRQHPVPDPGAPEKERNA